MGRVDNYILDTVLTVRSVRRCFAHTYNSVQWNDSQTCLPMHIKGFAKLQHSQQRNVTLQKLHIVYLYLHEFSMLTVQQIGIQVARQAWWTESFPDGIWSGQESLPPGFDPCTNFNLSFEATHLNCRSVKDSSYCIEKPVWILKILLMVKLNANYFTGPSISEECLAGSFNFW